MIGSHLVLLAAATTAAGIAMTQLGIAKRHLERVTRPRCSCCGRLLSIRGCEHCED
jgi:hypothetical protein